MPILFKFGVPISCPAGKLRNGDILVEFGSEGEYAKIVTLDRTKSGYTIVGVKTVPPRSYKFHNDDNVLLVSFPTKI